MKSIDDIEKSNKTVVVAKSGCPYCENAKKLLKKHNIGFEYVLYTEAPDLSKEIEEKKKHYTYPKIYLEGKWVGGYNELEKHMQNKN